MTELPPKRKTTRNQQAKRQLIHDAALDVFAENGLRGATLEAIARRAGLSKQNLIYYFPTKEAIYTGLLQSLLDIWLQPMAEIRAEGDPATEILTYVRRKLAISRDMPRESRLFATEVLQGAPLLGETLTGGLRHLVDKTAALFAKWAAEGRIADLDPHHLIFSIWAMTQHYADFDTQVSAVLGPARAEQRFDEAEVFTVAAVSRMIAP
ncbi:TetR family transcriptional regulator C-terminal domain-containing protein [Falsirhodobacter sp. alg1]|uniref:TetR family transcriptional regulator C-terminal domain-containing protein n=1 Tax=Falsirhodobacter sp. alg1 TaxID=1472418 RepID=UPI0005EDB834|nr:TetR family transcriptional regulator C-terminal domain-containing protein [Falsirhodobacter sp. alg1]